MLPMCRHMPDCTQTEGKRKRGEKSGEVGFGYQTREYVIFTYYMIGISMLTSEIVLKMNISLLLMKQNLKFEILNTKF